MSLADSLVNTTGLELCVNLTDFTPIDFWCHCFRRRNAAVRVALYPTPGGDYQSTECSQDPP